ncbi:nipped-B-like protein B [Echria macrotheca]|uniref:Nipped-B-like protein B n=1 Tax=Echria macrotheca TaxID=438768 RepID=A0AAJ0F5J3_9PEZI|nr:nipped-B-like protein B [Echria macrotheca]
MRRDSLGSLCRPPSRGSGRDNGTPPRSKPREKRSRHRDPEKEVYVYVDREKESLKQRMCRTNSTTPSPNRHGRTRSLSISGTPSPMSSFSSYDSERDRNHNHRPLVKYYHQDPFNLSSPKIRATWPSSPPESPPRSPDPDWERDRNQDRRRDRYERGFQIIEQRQSHSAAPRLSISPLPDDVRFGIQRMSLGPDARILSTRSSSFDVDRRRKSVSMSPGRAATSVHRPPSPQYTKVHVLILTWSFHDLRTASYTAPPTADYVSLEEETRRVRDTFQAYGYKVHEYLIPMTEPTVAMQAKLRQFCKMASDDTLLIVYYHGHGGLDEHNELVFSSHEHPANSEWSQAAAAELYTAILDRDACDCHGRTERYNELLKKYERYRPVAEVKWDDICDDVLGAPCDSLLVLDCCSAGGANLGRANWQLPTGQAYTKHLFAACGFESTTSDDMTAVMCDVLEEWVPGQGLHRDPSLGRRNDALSTPSVVSPFLTTKKLHQIMEHRLQKDKGGSQPIFKQLLPHDPEQYITLPHLLGPGTIGYGQAGRSRGRGRGGKGFFE